MSRPWWRHWHVGPTGTFRRKKDALVAAAASGHSMVTCDKDHSALTVIAVKLAKDTFK